MVNEETRVEEKTNRPGDEETREQVPEAEEEGTDNGGNLMAGSEIYHHDPVHGEIGKAHEYEDRNRRTSPLASQSWSKESAYKPLSELQHKLSQWPPAPAKTHRAKMNM